VNAEWVKHNNLSVTLKQVILSFQKHSINSQNMYHWYFLAVRMTTLSSRSSLYQHTVQKANHVTATSVQNSSHTHTHTHTHTQNCLEANVWSCSAGIFLSVSRPRHNATLCWCWSLFVLRLERSQLFITWNNLETQSELNGPAAIWASWEPRLIKWVAGVR